MAITINGSGTITGISAGGLPDGSVTAADLASGAITSGALPAGSVLQVVQVENPSSSVSTANTTDTATGHIASITPLSTSSKILFMLTGGSQTYGTVTTNCAVKIFRKIGAGSYSDTKGVVSYAKLNSTYNLSHSVCILDSPNTTSEVSYQVYFKSGNGNVVYYDYPNVDTNAMITLMEIAG